MANYWYQWCGSNTSTSLTTTSATAWVTWTASATSDSSATWVTWAGDSTDYVAVTTPYVDQRTAEQRAADDARIQAERQLVAARAKQAAEERAAARDRARQLLVAMLSEQQRQQYERDQFFEVIARNSRRRYRIRQGTHGNVRLLDDAGREVTQYCGQPNGVPDEDAMLAQKLMLEHDEDQYLRVANATRLRTA